jgi:Family of unknown function (DUF5675)
MKIEVKRDYFTQTTTLGKMYIDGVYFCETLEDTDRNIEDKGTKIAGLTAIPRGTYSLIMNMSKRFGVVMPQILDVPQFEGVRIHSGNTAKDTEGCIIVGLNRDTDNEQVTSSKLARDALYEKLLTADRMKESIEITVC